MLTSQKMRNYFEAVFGVFSRFWRFKEPLGASSARSL
jgi:hypothetical protein